ncbi:MAG: hypothetical protein ABMA64_31250 [Myxococcota bacterium]
MIAWTVALAQADCTPVAPRGDVDGVVVHVDGELTATVGDTLAASGCDGKLRWVVRGRIATLEGGEGPVALTVPASVTRLTVDHRSGSVVIAVPAEVALVVTEGPAEVRGAARLRVSWSTGDVTVDGVGDLVVDRLTGSIRGTALGRVALDGVTGEAAVSPPAPEPRPQG